MDKKDDIFGDNGYNESIQPIMEIIVKGMNK